MKSYLGLIPISERIHKRQSRMTRICIILAVFLVTSIFSMVEMWTKGEVESMRTSHGDWHIAVMNVSDDVIGTIRGDERIRSFALYEELNGDSDREFDKDPNKGYYIDGTDVELRSAEKSYFSDIMKYSLDGSFPEGDHEVALSSDARDILGKDIGDKIIITTPNGESEYTISGFYGDDSFYNKMIEGFCVYFDLDTFNSFCALSDASPVTKYFIRFEEEKGLKKTISEFKNEYGLSDKLVEENSGLLGFMGASSSKSMNAFYPLAGICFVIILISGVFMISSCMNSNVAQRTRFYGIMRCIGASRSQIIHFVRLQALNWCKTAVPIGLMLGTLTSWILCAILKFQIKGEWVNIPLFTISKSGLISGAVVGIITVYIAAYFPARVAARISPIAAVSGNTQAPTVNEHVSKVRFFKVETILGIHHAVSLKKNLILMTGSFALVITLFFVFAACLDIMNKLIPTQSSFTPDIVIASPDFSDTLDRSVEDEIAGLTGVDRTFALMMSVSTKANVNGKDTTIDLYSYEDNMFKKSEKSIISGDLSKVYGDSDKALVIYNQDSHLNVGDKIRIGDEEIEVACVASEGIGSISGTYTVVLSEESYMRITGDDKYAMLGAVCNKNLSEEEFSKIQNLAGENEFRDNREENGELYTSYWVFRIAIYGFLAIVSMITVLNITNSISMGVSSRVKQYGVMRAIGMGKWQVTRMIAAEALSYAVVGIVCGSILGLYLHYTIYEKVLITHFGGSWNIPYTSIIIIIVLVLASCVIAIYSPSKRMSNMEITETMQTL